MTTTPLHPRVRAVAELCVAEVREGAGRHEYDGLVQDLSPAGVSRGLAALPPVDGPAEPLPDLLEEQHLAVHEASARTTFSTMQAHRTNPLLHLSALDLSDYERDYAPLAEREAARAEHLRRWPDAVATAVETLDAVPGPVARSLAPAVGGLTAALRPQDGAAGEAGRAAVQRLVAHLEEAARTGAPDPAIGRAALEELMTVSDGLPFDATAVASRAEQERSRLHVMLREGLARLGRSGPAADEVAALLTDHPSADGVLAEARALSERVVRWTGELDLAPVDGRLLVEESPPARRWAVAMMAWAAPFEAAGPSLYSITPPDRRWPPEEQEQWLTLFSRTTLPVITVHEVAPGHYAHGCALRRCTGDVRRTLQGAAFAEGWAHYTEELALELGFSDDPRFQVGVAMEALCRVVRLEAAIGVHTGAFDVTEATRRFEEHAHLEHAAARAEAQRATFDPAYGCYTWGKWAVLDARERARAAWGERFSLPAFHRTLLALGSPPVGLLRAAVDAGPVA